MPVKSDFRCKYLLACYPLETVTITTTVTVFAGGFAMQLCEPALRSSYWRATFEV